MLSETDDAVESWTTKQSDVSFPKNLVFLVKPSSKFCQIIKKNSKGARIEPCVTAAAIFDQIE